MQLLPPIPVLDQTVRQVPTPWDPDKLLALLERQQNMWEKGWQSTTATVLLGLLLLVLALLVRSQHHRVKDREKADARLDLATAKTAELAKETHASVAENGKQVLVFSHELAELRREIADAVKAIEGLRRR